MYIQITLMCMYMYTVMYILTVTFCVEIVCTPFCVYWYALFVVMNKKVRYTGCWVYMYMLWFNFILGLHFIFLCLVIFDNKFKTKEKNNI